MTSQLVGTGTTINDVLVQIARHAVEGTRALSAGIIVMGEDHKLGAGGGYSPVGPTAARPGRPTPVSKRNAARLASYDWRGACVCPMSWENRTFGYLRANFPSTVTRPSESELAFYTALADQATLAVMNARFAVQAGQASAIMASRQDGIAIVDGDQALTR